MSIAITANYFILDAVDMLDYCGCELNSKSVSLNNFGNHQLVDRQAVMDMEIPPYSGI